MKIPTKKKDDLDYMEQHGLSGVLAMIFEKACQRYNLQEFTFSFLKSNIFKEFFVNPTIFSQSPLYVITLYLEELEEKKQNIHSLQENPSVYDTEVAYWIGYLLGEWYQEYCFVPEEFTLQEYKALYDGYEVLHTQSVKYVAEYLLEEYGKNNCNAYLTAKERQKDSNNL